MRAELRDSLEHLYPDSEVGAEPCRSTVIDVARGGTVAVHVLLNDLKEGATVRIAVRTRKGPLGAPRWFRLIDVPVEANTGPVSFIEKEGDGEGSVGHIDDFICQECTPWSGLGAIDVLAAVLDITEDDRQCLRGWYERHAAAYKVLTADADVMEAHNVYSEERYLIRMNTGKPTFRAGQLVLGSLVSWRGEWHWSGEQKVINNPTLAMIEDLKATMKRRSPRILCRYWRDYEKKVRERAQALHARSLEYHGKDLLVYPDGLSMAVDWQKEFRHYLDSLPKENVAEAIEKHGLKKNGLPEMKIPDELLNEKDGVGVYLNPDEGKEIMQGFNPVLSGFRRGGEGLTEDEAEAARSFIISESISPRFVRLMVDEYGGESIRAAFLLKGCPEDYCLDYLLRRYKGRFYRKRYPHLSVI